MTQFPTNSINDNLYPKCVVVGLFHSIDKAVGEVGVLGFVDEASESWEGTRSKGISLKGRLLYLDKGVFGIVGGVPGGVHLGGISDGLEFPGAMRGKVMFFGFFGWS